MVSGQEELNETTRKIIGHCFKIHSDIGPGFPERIYENALVQELCQNSIIYEQQKSYNLIRNGNKLGKLRLDLVVENRVLVEVKSVCGLMPKLFRAQVESYLRASGLEAGLLINFGNLSCEVKRIKVR